MAQQAIQFTKPVDKDPSDKANAFMPGESYAAPSAFNAPGSLYGGKGPITRTSTFCPAVPRHDDVHRQHADGMAEELWMIKETGRCSRRKKSSAFPRPEKILGIVDPNDDPKLSAEERFLRRQERQSDMGASNAMHRAEAMMWPNDDSTDYAISSCGREVPVWRKFSGSVPGSSGTSKHFSDKIRTQ